MSRPDAATPLYVIFDGPPSHESGRFVEVENLLGESVGLGGAWSQRPDGLWQLGPFFCAPVTAEPLIAALQAIHTEALDNIDGATESTGSDTRWTRIAEQAETALRAAGARLP
jgi:hypothetical protein